MSPCSENLLPSTIFGKIMENIENQHLSTRAEQSEVSTWLS